MTAVGEHREVAAEVPRLSTEFGSSRSAGEILLVAGTTLAIFSLWAAIDGGYAVTLWYPAALLLLILIGVLDWGSAGRQLARGENAALLALSALTAWCYLSILWAQDRGLALTGANRTLAYLLLFIVVVRRRWDGNYAVKYLFIWASTIVAIGIVDLVHTGGVHGVVAGFAAGRLSSPVEYANANAALFMLAAWPLILTAQSSAAPLVVRGVALASGGVAIELAVLAQSRGAAIATAVTVVLILAVLRNRLRILVAIALIAAVVAVVHGPLLAVYQRVNEGHRAAAAIRAAEYSIAASFVALVAAGIAVAWLDSRLLASSKAWRTFAPRVVAAAGAAVVIGLGAVAINQYGNPVSVAERTWHAFKYPAQMSSKSSHFLTSAGNHRYDFWRVAANQFRASPIMGSGVDNFAADYVRLRRSSEEPLYPHSLEARLLGGTGLVGFLCFAVFATILVKRCFSRARSQPELGLAGMIGGAMFFYWLIHGSVDWLWEFPALTGPVIAAVACGAATGTAAPRELGRKRRRSVSHLALPILLLAAGIALAPAWLAERDTSLAIGLWRTQPALADSDLARAARLNPLSDEPYLIAGTIAIRRRQWVAARLFFTKALGRNRSNWYAHFEEGVAMAKLGEHTQALHALRSAAKLDPREPVVAAVATALRHNQPVSADAIDRVLADRASMHPH